MERRVALGKVSFEGILLEEILETFDRSLRTLARHLDTSRNCPDYRDSSGLRDLRI